MNASFKKCIATGQLNGGRNSHAIPPTKAVQTKPVRKRCASLEHGFRVGSRRGAPLPEGGAPRSPFLRASPGSLPWSAAWTPFPAHTAHNGAPNSRHWVLAPPARPPRGPRSRVRAQRRRVGSAAPRALPAPRGHQVPPRATRHPRVAAHPGRGGARGLPAPRAPSAGACPPRGSGPGDTHFLDGPGQQALQQPAEDHSILERRLQEALRVRDGLLGRLQHPQGDEPRNGLLGGIHSGGAPGLPAPLSALRTVHLGAAAARRVALGAPSSCSPMERPTPAIGSGGAAVRPARAPSRASWPTVKCLFITST